MRGSAEIMEKARKARTVIPAFNIPYLPMMEPVIRALRDTECFAFIAVSRNEWEKFQAGSPKAVYDRYQQLKDERFTRLHQDHVPVIDEDDLRVDYAPILEDAVAVGYESVMVDASRVPFEENIAATESVVDMAHRAGIPVEAELGMVFGHEAGPMPSYEELYRTGKGFTDPDEAVRFVRESGVDWLSVSVGNIHGAISAARDLKKVAARINIEHLDRIARAVNRPIVLHGGTGIQRDCLLEAIRHGVCKLNIATAIRQPYEAAMNTSVASAQEDVYRTTVKLIREELEITGSGRLINPQDDA